MPDFEHGESGAGAHRFAPASPEEEFVYGACSPGWHTVASQEDAIADWIEVMRANDVERVCCLLPGGQSTTDCGGDDYEDAFGPDRVKHAPVPDNRLVSPALLDQEILPFLDEAVAAEERVVVHGLAGLGRTGQVLAVWLAHHREYAPERAIETVEAMGRQPREVVVAGSASEDELYDLIAAFA